MTQRKLWRYLLPVLLTMMLVGGFGFGNATSVAADDGTNISGGVPNTQNGAEGISQDYSKLCVVWSQFDQSANDVWIRTYNIASGQWSNTFQVSADSGKATFPHCAWDTQGNLHVAWSGGGNPLNIYYRFLPAGQDAGNSAAWSQIFQLQSNGDESDVDALYGAPDGKVWLVYRDNFNGVTNTFDLVARSWSNATAGNPGAGWSGPLTIASGTAANFPRIAVDNAGFVNVIYMVPQSGGDQYSVRDPNTGQFSTPVQVPGSSNTNTPGGLAVDRSTGTVHIVYGNQNTNFYYVQRPRGGAFSNPRTIAQSGSTLNSARIAWSPSGRLLAVVDDGKNQILGVTSGDGGANWGQPFTVASPGGGSEQPWVVAGADGTGYVIYSHRADASLYFTTIASQAPPAVSNVSAQANTMTSVTVRWTVSSPSTSRVFFAPGGTVDPNTSPSVGDPTPTTTPAITLRNLQPGTQYSYIVRSTNGNGSTLSSVQHFTTPDIELVGVHDSTGVTLSGDGTFAGLVWGPAGATGATWSWSLDGGQPHAITSFGAGKKNPFGNPNPVPNVAAGTPAITVTFTGNPAKASTVAPLHIDPSLAAQQPFSDVNPTSTSPYAVAIYSLRAQGMINGYQPQGCAQRGLAYPCFGPVDQIQRGASAALVVRALGWQDEVGLQNFSDQGFTDPETWNDVRVLSDNSIAFGFGDGTYRPTASVTWGQMISLISRAMVAKGFWQWQDPTTGCFPGVGTSPVDQRDLATYCHYVPALKSNADFDNGAAYKVPAQRRFVAWLLWEAVQTAR
jgi:hypothetical protein